MQPVTQERHLLLALAKEWEQCGPELIWALVLASRPALALEVRDVQPEFTSPPEQARLSSARDLQPEAPMNFRHRNRSRNCCDQLLVGPFPVSWHYSIMSTLKGRVCRHAQSGYRESDPGFHHGEVALCH